MDLTITRGQPQDNSPMGAGQVHDKSKRKLKLSHSPTITIKRKQQL